MPATPHVRLALLKLSRGELRLKRHIRARKTHENPTPGGADAVEIREFDLDTKTFVGEKEKKGFFIKEAKSSVSYKDKDTLLVGSDFGEGGLFFSLCCVDSSSVSLIC
jgi:hypothetical protein